MPDLGSCCIEGTRSTLSIEIIRSLSAARRKTGERRIVRADTASGSLHDLALTLAL